LPSSRNVLKKQSYLLLKILLRRLLFGYQPKIALGIANPVERVVQRLCVVAGAAKISKIVVAIDPDEKDVVISEKFSGIRCHTHSPFLAGLLGD